MYQISNEKFGLFVTELRKKKNLTQKDLAEKLYVSDKTVSKWERGLSMPNVVLLIPIADVCYELIRAMQLVGINVITRTEVEECFAVIDDEIVWHGGMNLLGKADVWDNLMRIRNSQVATELLEIALGCSEERRKSE